MLWHVPAFRKTRGTITSSVWHRPGREAVAYNAALFFTCIYTFLLFVPFVPTLP
jgi:hypothetical protein